VLNCEEEDDGLEKQPSDTVRAPQDADPSKVSTRTRRNMLPCDGELHKGEVWNRTADLRGMYMSLCAGPTAANAAKLKMAGQLFQAAMSTGSVEDLRRTLVEPFCGSCGLQRQDGHKVEKERGLLVTHHPSAPAMKVCSCTWDFGSTLRPRCEDASATHVLFSSFPCTDCHFCTSRLSASCSPFRRFLWTPGVDWSVDVRRSRLQARGGV